MSDYTCPASVNAISGITLCDDGYVRLTRDTLLAIPLVHLLSGLDEDHSNIQQADGRPTRIAGYTEWLSVTKPAITIGWDWALDVFTGRVRYTRLGDPCSNLMLVDAEGGDLGPVQTTVLLTTTLDALAWQAAVHEALARRYT